VMSLTCLDMPSLGARTALHQQRVGSVRPGVLR
jgi:hypothetical protein